MSQILKQNQNGCLEMAIKNQDKLRKTLGRKGYDLHPADDAAVCSVPHAACRCAIFEVVSTVGDLNL